MTRFGVVRGAIAAVVCMGLGVLAVTGTSQDGWAPYIGIILIAAGAVQLSL